MIAVTGHFERSKVKNIVKKLSLLMKKHGFRAAMLDISSSKLKRGKFDFICVVGGDGSLLRAARESVQGTVLLGIAAGKRGYLMQVKPSQLKRAVKRIAGGKYCIEEMARLQGISAGKKLPLALNELLVVPKKSGSLMECTVIVGGKKKKISCDGLIVATPTGSTGHAYSAGGRKLREEEKKFIVVPSNPLDRQWKPFTVSNRKRISIMCPGIENDVEVVVDGRERFKLREKLLIERGNSALLLKIKGL